ncbi:TIGR03936 family radical SAM-associated protein [Collinsella sp. An2]|uniref:TIGR03936 family radical SAM-associated protein n=1 Tax=Collinsella sp. An2 TaxID=1965585 RepID=UPI000B376CF7|nr:TIGR03936 family radical SAM-associated protein [Collinsella sp. An2]OUP08260.1 hypothetical protein B5F33_07565 [Collinsella sp. An2]
MSETGLFRLRVSYGKRGRLRYLGHLEVLHTIERVVRRARLPYAVTQGFSPHMRVAFSSALPVGTASGCEWFDLILTEYVPAQDALQALQAAAPSDLAAIDAGYIDMRAPSLTAFIVRATYEARVQFVHDIDPDAFDRAIATVRERNGIDYRRGRKTKRLDLDRTLCAVKTSWDGPRSAKIVLETRLDNDGAMRPELFLAACDLLLAGEDYLGDPPRLDIGPYDFACIDRVVVERVSQEGEDADGHPIAPLAVRC